MTNCLYLMVVPFSKVRGSFQRSNLFRSHFGKTCSLVSLESSTWPPHRKQREGLGIRLWVKTYGEGWLMVGVSATLPTFPTVLRLPFARVCRRRPAGPAPPP